MNKPKICASLVSADTGAIKEITPLVDFFEVRIDLIGAGWQELAKLLKKPWIACNRSAKEGGRAATPEDIRVSELLKAIEPGAGIVDIELSTGKLARVVPLIKRKAQCLISHHDTERTPPPGELKKIVEDELNAGADICKVVTTANSFDDNMVTVQLIKEFPEAKLVSFCMGKTGQVSRILCPIVGGYFTYASTGKGKESAPGQMTIVELRKLYDIGYCHEN